MVLANKVENPGNLTLPQFALFALNKFRQAHHTQSYQPEKIEASPQDIERLPEKTVLTIGGIPVVPNGELEPGFMRVCTCDIEGLED